jgi:riboflavin biosynthesis pyrimidine reductase
MNISSVLVEGGTAIITSLIRQRLVDKYIVISAPKIMGKGIDAVGDLGILDIDSALKLSFVKAYRNGQDLIIEAKPQVDEA